MTRFHRWASLIIILPMFLWIVVGSWVVWQAWCDPIAVEYVARSVRVSQTVTGGFMALAGIALSIYVSISAWRMDRGQS